jgi:hypothetical protein
MRRFAISTSLAALAVLAFTAGPASAAGGMKVGIEDESVFVSGNPVISSTQGYQMLDDLGIKTMRVLVTQSSVQTGNNFDFVAYQNMLQQARSNGVAVQVVLVGKYPRPNYSSWAKFAQAAGTAFKGKVSFYSIWNEPNLNAWIKGSNKGAIYRKLYTAGYKAIRKGDSSAKILMGETSPGIFRSRGIAPLKFLRQLACVDNDYKPLKGKKCPALKANGYAHHPYDLDHAPRQSNLGPDSATIGTLGNLRKALNKLRGRLRGTRTIYLTEFGYALTGPHKLPASKAAAYLKQSVGIARRTPQVKELIQYLLINPASSKDPFPTGLLSNDGDPNPLYAALKSAI